MFSRAAASLQRAPLRASVPRLQWPAPRLSAPLSVSAPRADVELSLDAEPTPEELAAFDARTQQLEERKKKKKTAVDVPMPWKPEAPKFYNPRIDVVSTFMNIPPLEDPLLKMLVGMLTTHGKSNRARGTAARVLHHLHALTRAPPLPIFREGLFAIAPLAKSKKWNTSALKHFMKPAPLTERRSMFHAMTWLLSECGNPGPLPLEERIAREIMDIHNGKSTLLNKRLEWHKEAMISKANVNTRPQTSRRSR